MCPRQLFIITPTLNCEFLIAVATLQFSEAIHGHARCARHELQESQPQLVRERIHGHPEPLDHPMVGVILAFVDRVQLPVLNIHVPQTRQQELEFFRVEDEDASLWHNLSETFHKARHLFFDALHEPPLDHQVDELFFVVVRYFDVLSARFEFVFDFLEVK